MGRLTNLNPRAPISDEDLPSSITRDTELRAEIEALAFRKSTAYNVSVTADNPNNHQTGLKSNDAYVGGILSGWHFFTTIRPDNADFGAQIAISDTLDGVKYRRKTSGVWQNWVTLV